MRRPRWFTPSRSTPSYTLTRPTSTSSNFLSSETETYHDPQEVRIGFLADPTTFTKEEEGVSSVGPGWNFAGRSLLRGLSCVDGVVEGRVMLHSQLQRCKAQSEHAEQGVSKMNACVGSHSARRPSMSGLSTWCKMKRQRVGASGDRFSTYLPGPRIIFDSLRR